jgi:hypothetical protein
MIRCLQARNHQKLWTAVPESVTRRPSSGPERVRDRREVYEPLPRRRLLLPSHNDEPKRRGPDSGFAVLLTMTGRYRASAPFYGLAPKSMPRSCPVVASYRARDLILKSSPARLECNLTQLGVPHDVKFYPEAGHSFYTHAPNRVAKLIGPLTPLRAQYHQPSARDRAGAGGRLLPGASRRLTGSYLNRRQPPGRMAR